MNPAGRTARPARPGRRGSTPRTERLAWDAAENSHGGFYEEEALCESFTAPEGLSDYLVAAHQFAHVWTNLPPFIRGGELIVGARRRTNPRTKGWGWSPDGESDYVSTFAHNAPPGRPDIQAMASRGLISPAGSLNHKVADYAGYIRVGSAALAERARSIAETKTGRERDFAVAFAMGHEAIIAHAANYAAAAEEMAETAAPEQAGELLDIARVCRNVPAGPAETFHEAGQSFWFAYMIAGDGLGRPDVFLNDYYRADLAAGRITPERALELIECLMIKIHGDYVSADCNVSSVQTMTLAGQLPDGSDATNDLTPIFLTAVRNIRLLRPTVYIRCHENTPDNVLTLAATMLAEGLAEPNFYGDQPIIEGLVRNGIPVEIARDYALSGCTEVVSPGRGNWGGVSGWINLAMLADDAIRDCARGGDASSDRLWEAIQRHANDVADACRVSNCWLDDRDTSTHYHGSLMMPCCLDRCVDVAHGGAESAIGQWEAMGLPNAAEMIYAAERFACDEGEPLGAVLARLDAEDPAVIRQLRTFPKFGNDCPELDEIGSRLITMLSDALERRSTPLRSSLMLGHLAGGENMHIPYGRALGATLDGRLGGQPLADSLAGSQGCTKSGPTALVRSLCKLDHSRIAAGNISTLRLGTADFATPEGIAKVVALIKTFVAMGGSQLQINVADADTLRDAQEHPEQYAGLLVRVAGYSAHFTGLGRTLQNEIIARTEGLTDAMRK